jgi:hypothetical protein
MPDSDALEFLRIIVVLCVIFYAMIRLGRWRKDDEGPG